MASVTPHSLSVGQLVGRSTGIYLRNLLPFTLLGVMFLAPWIALDLCVDKVLDEPPMPRRYAQYIPREPDLGVMLLPLASLILQSLLAFLLTGAVTYGVVQQLRGQPASLAHAVSKGLSSFARVCSAAFLCSLRILLFSLLLIIPGIVQEVKLYVAIPAAVMEDVGGRAAMARSRGLIHGSGWQIFGAWLLSAVIGFGLGMLGVAVDFMAHDKASAFPPHEYRAPVWFDIAIQLVVGPFSATMMATAYFLLRQGKENVDAKQIAAVFD
jgi:hypothetical protein